MQHDKKDEMDQILDLRRQTKMWRENERERQHIPVELHSSLTWTYSY